MKVAIVILNWNGKSWLEKFLPNIIEFSPKDSVYVIDNCSTDDSIFFLEQNFPNIHIIQNNQNKGFAGGYNDGLSKISADVFCLLNSDVEVTPDWISSILSLFETDENIAAIQPKILSYHQRDAFEYAGGAGGMLDALGYPYCRGRIFNTLEKDRGQYDTNTEIIWASGCALFIRSKDFWKIGGFDERFFAHQEEIDLCWRLRNTGKKIMYCAKSTVYHVGGGTLQKGNPQKTFLNFRNNLSMLLKNLPSSLLPFIIFTRLVLDGIAGVRFLFIDGWQHTWAIVRAHFSFYAQIPTSWKLRKKQKKITPRYYTTKSIFFTKKGSDL